MKNCIVWFNAQTKQSMILKTNISQLKQTTFLFNRNLRAIAIAMSSTSSYHESHLCQFNIFRCVKFYAARIYSKCLNIWIFCIIFFVLIYYKLQNHNRSKMWYQKWNVKNFKFNILEVVRWIDKPLGTLSSELNLLFKFLNV